MLRDLLSLLALAENRHVIRQRPAWETLAGAEPGLAHGRRQGAAQLKLAPITIAETALLDDAAKAVQGVAKQADDGILFLPGVQRFLGNSLDAEFPKATTAVRRAFLDGRGAVVIATVTDADYSVWIANDALITERSHILRVSETSVADTTTILVDKPTIEREYSITINDKALGRAATLAKRSWGIHCRVLRVAAIRPWRWCAWVISRMWPSVQARTPTRRWTKRIFGGNQPDERGAGG